MSALDEYRLLTLTVPEDEILRELDLPPDVRGVLRWLAGNRYVGVEDALARVLVEGAEFPQAAVRMYNLMLHMFACTAARVPSPEFTAKSPFLAWGSIALQGYDEQTSTNMSLEWAQNIRPRVRGAWIAALKVSGDLPAEGHTVYTHVCSLLSNLRCFHEEIAPIFTPNFFDYATAGMMSPTGAPAATLRWRL